MSGGAEHGGAVPPPGRPLPVTMTEIRDLPVLRQTIHDSTSLSWDEIDNGYAELTAMGEAELASLSRDYGADFWSCMEHGEAIEGGVILGYHALLVYVQHEKGYHA